MRPRRTSPSRHRTRNSHPASRTTETAGRSWARRLKAPYREPTGDVVNAFRQEDREGMTSRREVPATIVAISGSLRRSSINSAVLRAAAAAAARDGTRVVIDHSVRELPHFDPDLEIDPPEAVL